jgi:chemotaxis response regulator CheB
MTNKPSSTTSPLSKRAEFAVAVASNREEALKQVVGFAANVIALNVLMPKLDE